jgi:hypothetical protein
MHLRIMGESKRTSSYWNLYSWIGDASSKCHGHGNCRIEMASTKSPEYKYASKIAKSYLVCLIS